MPRPSINAVLADNLRHFMSEKKLTQLALSKLTCVSQSSISNYLRPASRAGGKLGKEPSAKLSEVDMLASALGVEAWELIRFINPAERAFYKQVEQSYRNLLSVAKSDSIVIN